MKSSSNNHIPGKDKEKSKNLMAAQETHLADLKGEKQPLKIQSTSLQELKAVFLAMDWEISDETLNKLINTSEELMRASQDDVVLMAYFKMLSSLGKYIKIHKASADKDAVGLLHSIYKRMEDLIAAEKMPEHQRKRLVADKIREFKALKQKISSSGREHSSEKLKAKTTMNIRIQALEKEWVVLRREVNALREKISDIMEKLEH